MGNRNIFVFVFVLFFFLFVLFFSIRPFCQSMSLQPPQMGNRSMDFFFLSVSLYLYCSSLNTLLTMAADSISPGQSLTGEQTIISKEGNFVLGFFTPGNSQNYYIGIWFKKVTTQNVVWVANRETPLPDKSSQLKISEDGNLLLLSHKNSIVWSTNSTSMTTNFTVALLQDNGNLVLRDGSNSSASIWQSFDYPTDTWLPTGWFGLNKITGWNQRLTSWRSTEDPAPGPFSLEFDPRGTEQYFLVWNGSQQYWRTGEWDGQIFGSVPEMRTRVMFNFSYDADNKGNYLTYTIYNTSTITKFLMDVSGQIKQLTWLEESRSWNLFWSKPQVQCEVYSLCGAFSLCDENDVPCKCLQGFEVRSLKEWNLSDWSGGCVRTTRLQCENNSPINGEGDKFLLISNLQLPKSRISLRVSSIDDCELACLNNCSCNAYAYDGGCMIWNSEITNLRVSSRNSDGKNLYLRLAASELRSLSSKKGKFTRAAIGTAAAAGAVALLGMVLVAIWRCRQRRVSISLKVTEGSLVAISYRDLQIVTKNFSEKLGGGGFGSVSKGILPDTTAVAVKKLEGLWQGEKQFRSEVSTIGIVQHVNLIRLRGFCSEGSRRLLVYDFMPNGSLDSHLFQKNSATLDWRTRYQIAIGTARGLAYLHEKCRDYIIHCDIKPENILLDAEFCPKVADFGMAKLLGREFSKVLTTMRGTIGYLAPEWISGLPITSKADVYSYGMMLLEIISGIRNTNTSHNGSAVYFPVWAATKLHEGDVLSITDARLEGNVDMEELRRACIAACWCIQDQEASRPSMGQVIQILEGDLEVNIPPVSSCLQRLVEN